VIWIWLKIDMGHDHWLGPIPLLLLAVDLVSIFESQVEITFLRVLVLNQTKQQAPLPPKPK
jgi:hypothetical protein